MTVVTPHLRIAIAGASSLRGKEVATLLEERMPSADLRLLDDEVVEGVLTKAGGEPLVMQSTNEESFDGARFAFFTGTPEFTLRHWQQAVRAGATVVDLSGALRAEPAAVSWIPALRGKLAPPQPASGRLYHAPSTPAIVACTLAAALHGVGAEGLAIVFFQPVSERGREGVEELESQAVNLLSLKPISQEVYGAQVAFNLLGSYGAERKETLGAVRAEIATSVAAYLNGRVPAPAMQLVQAPVFYGCAFSAVAEFSSAGKPAEMERALTEAGVRVTASGEESPSSVSVAGESQIVMARIEPDSGSAAACWLWGAADNLRLAAANAISIAETLLAS